ncbi:unnamed protein product [Clavelina lepadiformis]|uniref:Uncharacterized protein n=1 Tax=Clavelina lepadiformis TaxID=159417 RepID=A0ABP0G3C0_CLALP
MSNSSDRILSFRDDNWPWDRINASPRTLADSGLYYLGDGDRVKCWYCGGGLQGWERNDDPWREHAKWYPSCEFLLQKKGPDFVTDIVNRFPNLQRPDLNQRDRQDHPAPNVESSPRPTTSSSVEIIDPWNERRRLDRRIEREMTSERALMVRQMGFSLDEIRTAVQRQFETRETFRNMEDMIDAILNLSVSESAPTTSRTDPPNQPSPLPRQNGVAERLSEEAREVRRLEESKLCKMCHSCDANMVFIPCGHLATCLNCGANMRTCCVCDAVVEERVRSYIV